MTATEHNTTANVCAPSSGMSSDAPVTAVGRFDKKAMHYNRHAAIQRDMAAWLAQWLPPQSVIAADATGCNTSRHSAQNTDAERMRAVAQKSPADAEAAYGNVLDLGAGDGTFTRHLTQRFTNVSALDSSEQMLCEGSRNLPQVNWLRGDAWTLQPLGAEALRHTSLITSSSLLQWCRTPAQTLRHWAQHCSPGTRMLHGLYVEPTLSQWRTLFGGSGQLDWLAPPQWEAAFGQNGWRILRSECKVRHYCFANALELARSLHGTGAIANAGQLGSGRFRALLRAYDAEFSIRNLPSTARLYSFDGTPPQHPADAGCNIAHTAPITPPQEVRCGALFADSRGVFASWAFFRIEAVRA